MASAVFKQQCPSCEAMVPIKEDFIGRKVDCPKCKYRFIAEEPADTDDDEPKAKKDKAAPAKKGAPVKKAAVAAKAGPRRSKGDDDDDDHDDDDQPKKKGKKAKSDDGGGGPSKPLLIGIGLAGVAVVLLGVALFFMLGGDDTPSKGPSASTGGPGPVSSPSTTPTTAEITRPTTPTGGGLTLIEATNLLPRDTEVVVTVNIKDLLKSPMGRSAFVPGAFRKEQFEEKFGLSVDEVDRVLLAVNETRNWIFCVVRTAKAVDMKRLEEKLGLKSPSDSPVSGIEYFVTEPVRFDLNQVPGAPPAAPVEPRPLALCLRDRQTLVVAHQEPMNEFLKQKGQPPLQSSPDAAAPGGAGGPPGVPGNPPVPGVPPGAPPVGPPGAPPPAGAATPPGFPPGVAPPPPPLAAGGAPGFPGGPPGPGGPAAKPVASKHYLSVSPDIKALLDQVEGKQAPLLSLAAPIRKNALANPWLRDNPQLAASAALLQDLTGVGLAVQMTEGISASAALRCRNEKVAGDFKRQLQGLLTLAAANAKDLPIELKFTRPQDGGPGRPGFPGAPPGTPPGFPGAPPGAPGAPPVFPGAPGQPPGAAKPGEAENQGKVQLDVRSDRETVVLTADWALDEKAYELLFTQMQPQWIRARGLSDLEQRLPPWHTLAGVAPKYTEKAQAFPRGTFDRGLNTNRGDRPWPPNQRVSWMAELLPYLGQDALRRSIKTDLSWRDPENNNAAISIVREFLDPSYGSSNFFVNFPGMKETVAATHFVGIAGIGLDAAEYPEADAALAKKQGILGYDRVTRLSDVADGLANTMLMVQVPPTYKRPWLAGGGATLQGVPETKSVAPFVCTQHNGKKGTYALMADGSVRFVADTVSDDVFKAMATMRGGESVSLDVDAPKVPPGSIKVELKAKQVVSEK